MSLAPRRRDRRAAATRSGRVVRAGFTLVEMLISVTLVLLMMLMFAEIYGLAQQTMTTQRGIAENDQKARILSEVLRRDLDTRTFRSVYPFKLEMVVATVGGSNVLRPNDAFATDTDKKLDLISKRRGYFSFSENHPAVDTDDTLQLTIDASDPRWGRPSDRIYGLASPYTPDPGIMPVPPPQEGPEFDDSVLGNYSGSSGAAEVSYFLRAGNLYRSVLLVREPYRTPTTSSDATPEGFPRPYPQFRKYVDFSAYRWPDGGGGYEMRFHGPGSLENNTDGRPPTEAYLSGPPNLYVPQFLSTPHLRFGHISGDEGNPTNAMPLEYMSGSSNFDSVVVNPPRTRFFGRFTLFERSDPDFAYPGSGWSPFDNVTALDDTSPPNTVLEPYEQGDRRGVDLMLSNVHSFDIKVWDDVVGDFVDLGHLRSGENPYIVDASGNHPVQEGFYHRSRLRRPISKETVDPATENGFYDHPVVATDFGNRYDTWSPLMYVSDVDLSNSANLNDPAVQFWRTGRAPYRPQKSNPDPNDPAYNDPTSGAQGREPAMVFGNDRLNIDEVHDDGVTFLGGDPDESDAEVPLRAIQITIRYLDLASGQTRQTTIEQSLVD